MTTNMDDPRVAPESGGPEGYGEGLAGIDDRMSDADSKAIVMKPEGANQRPVRKRTGSTTRCNQPTVVHVVCIVRVSQALRK